MKEKDFKVDKYQDSLNFDPDCLPAWANWIAMDKNKDWRWHRYKPKKPKENDFFWVEPIKWEFKIGDCGRIPEDFVPKNFKGNWKESLFSVKKLRKMKELGKY